MVWCNVEDAQYLVEHLAVLTVHGHDGLVLILTDIHFVDERAHLDGLRESAEDERYFLFSIASPA